jgi:hypothetical protein
MAQKTPSRHWILLLKFEKYDVNLKVVNVAESPAINAVPHDTNHYLPESMIVLSKHLDQMHQEILRKALDHAHKVKPISRLQQSLEKGSLRLK